MEMSLELVIYTLSVLAFGTVLFGAIKMLSVKSFETQKEEAERLFRQRLFEGDEKTKKKLGKFFREAQGPIFISALNFASAFVLFVIVAKRLWPTDSVLKTIISLVILLVIFGGPIIALTLAGRQLAWLKNDIMRKFKTQS